MPATGWLWSKTYGLLSRVPRLRALAIAGSPAVNNSAVTAIALGRRRRIWPTILNADLR